MMIEDYNSKEGRAVTADSLSRVEVCVQDMAEAGFKNFEIATALATHLMMQLKIAFPNKKFRDIWLRSLLASDLD